jgi:hypothetical protein
MFNGSTGSSVACYVSALVTYDGTATIAAIDNHRLLFRTGTAVRDAAPLC